MTAKRPNFFVVGAPKCGTTALHYYLKQHPDIFMPEYKEPSYFHVHYETPNFQRYRGDLDKYLSLFASATTEKRIGEASPGYIYSEQAAREIYTFDPSAKIIISLREPISMLNSTYHHQKYMGDETAPTFAQALQPELASPSLQPDSTGWLYLPRVGYAAAVRRYQQQFGASQVHVVLFDDIQNHLADAYCEILEFLEVEPAFQPDFEIVNQSKQMRETPLHHWLNQLDLSPSSIRDSRWFHWLTGWLPPDVYRQLIAVGVKLYAQPQSKMAVPMELRTRLREVLQPEIDELSDLLDRDLSHWCH